MAAARETTQTITRLTPLAELAAFIDRDVKPIMPSTIALADAAHAILAQDVVAPVRPDAATALIDGWALAAEATLDAGGYAPAPLAEPPARVEVGDVMPPGTDCVAPLDLVNVANGRAEVLGVIASGNGVLPAGGDNDSSEPLRHAGQDLRAIDLAAGASAGVSRVTVRQPRLCVAPLRGNSIVAAAARAIAADIERHGGRTRLEDETRDLAELLNGLDTDALIAIGGTGAGRNDTAVRKLDERGRVAVHGLALTPGETMAFGVLGARPVLLLPGRLDAALAVWLTAGRHMLARLAGADPDYARRGAEYLPLGRKVTSTVGLAEFIPVRRVGSKVEPLASKYLPLSALTRSDGWILVPPASEGYSAGAVVSVSPWP